MDSYIEARNGQCVSFVGGDATNYVRATILSTSLRLYAQSGIIPTRGVTATKMLKMATGYTGKTYKRGQYEQAATDVFKWASEMKAALPIVTS
jgi:hypothetical protein